jgi:multisubunit Na+/H+ antiporter MnhB subunit
MPDRWRSSQWLMPLVNLVLGGAILVARAMEDDLTGGLIWFAIFAAVAALYAVGGRSEPAREALGELQDERDEMINTRALAAAGLVLIVALTGCVLFELARGHDPSPYTQLVAGGGATYAVTLLILRRRS